MPHSSLSSVWRSYGDLNIIYCCIADKWCGAPHGSSGTYHTGYRPNALGMAPTASALSNIKLWLNYQNEMSQSEAEGMMFNLFTPKIQIHVENLKAYFIK